MVIGTNSEIFTMEKFNVELDKLRDWNKAGQLLPKAGDGAYNFLYHLPANYDIPVATLSIGTIVYNLVELESAQPKRLKVLIVSCMPTGGYQLRNPDKKGKGHIVCKDINELHNAINQS